MVGTFYNLSSGDLEFVPLMFHHCAMFLTCVLAVLKPVISLTHLVSCSSYWLPLLTQVLHTPWHHVQVPLETILLVFGLASW